MEAKLIDNNFYKLSDKIVKSITVGNRLPKIGYERLPDKNKLAELTLLTRYGQGWRDCGMKAANGWITRTPISYFDGKENFRGWVWALHVTEYQNK